MQKRIPTYNDGFVTVYRKKETATNRNIRSASDLDVVEMFAFAEMSRRQQDLEFAEQASFSLSMKVKVPRPVEDKGIDAYCYAAIGETLYKVAYLDTNTRDCFLYLEKVGKLKGEDDGSE